MSTINGVHKYFDRKPTKWNIREFLEECEEETFQRKIEVYLLSLETIADSQKGPRYDMARLLLDKYKIDRTDRKESRNWEESNKSESASKPSVNLYNPTITGSTINSLINSGTVDNSKRKQEGSDNDFQPTRQKRKKQLSLSLPKKDKKSVGSAEAKTTSRKEENVDDNIDNSFISDSSSSSIKTARSPFMSASLDNKQDLDSISVDVVQVEEEIRELTQDETSIRNKLLTILSAQQEKDIKSGKDFLSSTSLNNIIDLSNSEVQTEVNKSLNTNQIEWINRVLRKKVWNQTHEFQQYISQFTEDVCDRVHIPVLVRKSFVPNGSFNSYIHEAHDIAQQILTHFSVRLEAPRRVESESLEYERTYSIDTVIYIINRLFRMHQDVVDLVWIELTTPDTKKHKIDGLTKIINTTQKNQTIILIEFSFGRRASKSKEDDDHIKLCRNSMRTLNKLLQSIPKVIARVYLIQSVNGLIKIKYLVRPLPSIYILQLFTCIKIPVSFDDFEQFAKNIVDLMEWQVDMLSTVRAMNKVTTGNTRNHITLVQDTPVKKKEAEKNQPSSPKSPCPGGLSSELPPLI